MASVLLNTSSYTTIASKTSTVASKSTTLYIQGLITGQDEDTGRTTVSIRLRIKTSSGTFTSSDNTSTLSVSPSSAKVSGSTATKSYNIGTVSTTTKTIATWTALVFQHDDDGVMPTITVSDTSNVYGSTNITVSGSFTVPDIEMSTMNIAVGGVMKKATPYIGIGGVWKKCKAYIGNGEQWKKGK